MSWVPTGWLGSGSAVADNVAWLVGGRPSDEQAVEVLKTLHAASKELRVMEAQIVGYVMELRGLTDFDETPQDLLEVDEQDEL